ncbi:hypothetical protein TSMEX_002220 [Taenia solium]|eukprot:TsM_000345500 transcript=TsM_000345500 gene=TsM_000345500
MRESRVPGGLVRRLDEVLLMEESEKGRIFSEFLSSCDFSRSPQESIIFEKLGLLSQCMFKMGNYETKPQRVSELPQLLREVKAADMDILSDALKSFEFVPSLSATSVTSTLPEFYDPANIEKLRLDTSLLRERVGQLEEKLTHFGGLDTPSAIVEERMEFGFADECSVVIEPHFLTDVFR